MFAMSTLKANEPSNVGSGQICSVHERDTVHDTKSDGQAVINAMHNLALLGVCELGDARISGGLVGVGVLEEVGIVDVKSVALDDVLLSILGAHWPRTVVVVHVGLLVRHCGVVVLYVAESRRVLTVGW